MHKVIRVRLLLTGAALLVISAFILSLFLGKYPLTLSLLLEKNPQAVRVFLTLRLPRTCMAVLGGFSLGVAGYVYQTVFKNPLAAPDIIGVSSGASVGAAFGILFLSGTGVSLTFTAFVGGMLAVVLVLVLSALAPEKSTSSIVLAGIAIHALAQTLLMILKLTADPEKQLASIEYWIMGSLNAITLSKLPVPCVISLVCLVCIMLLHRHILMLSLDDDEAVLLGVPVQAMRLVILLLATLLVASVVSVTGLISFIGLLAPHIARMLLRDNRLPTLLLSGLTGSLLLCCADMLARSAASSELPVSIFTSLLGAPFLIYLLLRRNTT
jgi:iron complex transport system permease protein